VSIVYILMTGDPVVATIVMKSEKLQSRQNTLNILSYLLPARLRAKIACAGEGAQTQLEEPRKDRMRA